MKFSAAFVLNVFLFALSKDVLFQGCALTSAVPIEQRQNSSLQEGKAAGFIDDLLDYFLDLFLDDDDEENEYEEEIDKYLICRNCTINILKSTTIPKPTVESSAPTNIKVTETPSGGLSTVSSAPQQPSKTDTPPFPSLNEERSPPVAEQETTTTTTDKTTTPPPETTPPM